MFPSCLQIRFKCPFVGSSGKVLRLFASIHTPPVGVVLLVISHRARLVKLPGTQVFPYRSGDREPAHSEQYEIRAL